MNHPLDPYDIRTHLMEQALEEEQRNWVVRAWAILCLVIAGGYFFGFGILIMLFSKTIHPLPFTEADWFANWVISLPTAILLVPGVMGLIVSGHNGTMKLHEHEIAQFEEERKVWHNLPPFGRVLLTISGGALALGLIILALVILSRVLT